MKVLPLTSIIAVIGVSLTSLVFAYQYTQNCETEGGSIKGVFTCDKTKYGLISELFHKKYPISSGFVIDGSPSITELTSTNPHGNSVTLLLKSNQNGPYHAEIICKYGETGIQTITEDLLDYVQNETCFPVFTESEIEYFPITEPCDVKCKEYLESLNYTCTKMESNSYECREVIKPVHDGMIYTYVVPPELGEYYLITPDTEQQLESVAMVSIYENDFIKVTFDDNFNADSIIIEKDQKFTSYCFESKNVHVWTFTGIVEVSGRQYVEMHKRLAQIPSGFDCNNPIQVLGKS